ncbi:MAG TPA: hypothetical protein VLA80_03575 [Actinomycetota bacterium]|nr:hypothetical protein [Actinomycetota bacterium]
MVDAVPDEVAAQLWEDTKTALRECGVRKAAGPKQGSSGGWRVAQVLALDRDGVIARCRASDTCAES